MRAFGGKAPGCLTPDCSVCCNPPSAVSVKEGSMYNGRNLSFIARWARRIAVQMLETWQSQMCRYKSCRFVYRTTLSTLAQGEINMAATEWAHVAPSVSQNQLWPKSPFRGKHLCSLCFETGFYWRWRPIGYNHSLIWEFIYRDFPGVKSRLKSETISYYYY